MAELETQRCRIRGSVATVSRIGLVSWDPNKTKLYPSTKPESSRKEADGEPDKKKRGQSKYVIMGYGMTMKHDPGEKSLGGGGATAVGSAVGTSGAWGVLGSGPYCTCLPAAGAEERSMLSWRMGPGSGRINGTN